LQRIFDNDYKQKIASAWDNYYAQVEKKQKEYDDAVAEYGGYTEMVTSKWADYYDALTKDEVYWADYLAKYRTQEAFRYHYSKRVEWQTPSERGLRLYGQSELQSYFNSIPQNNLLILSNLIHFIRNKKADTKIIFLTTPMRYGSLLTGHGQQLEYVAEKLASEEWFNCDFYTLDLIKPEKFDCMGYTTDDDDDGKNYWDMRDDGHMSIYGMNKWSPIFAEFYNKIIDGDGDISEWLLSSTQEAYEIAKEKWGWA